jgi:hypothetical protein
MACLFKIISLHKQSRKLSYTATLYKKQCCNKKGMILYHNFKVCESGTGTSHSIEIEKGGVNELPPANKIAYLERRHPISLLHACRSQQNHPTFWDEPFHIGTGNWYPQ